jgi:hypothetical protein
MPIAIRTRYYGPTNTQGARIVASDGTHRITVYRHYADDPSVDHQRAAVALCKKMGWNTDQIGGYFGPDTMYWLDRPETGTGRYGGMACPAKIWHGPGHQSSTPCRLGGEHEVHEAVYGEFNQFARWRTRADGKHTFTGAFDEAPDVDDE